jgi:hypothetical protein
LSQQCSGQATRACGDCGTQHRSCDNGVWSPWGVCQSEGDCKPDEIRMCEDGGIQVCSGRCAWGECAQLACAGAAEQACGNCGTQTRTCDAVTGTWSVWGRCSQEGSCQPNTARDCPEGGTQVCGGACEWDALCANRACDGAASRACGLCGHQNRACDRNTGAWADWTVCFDEGACAPGSTRTCGNGGTQTCGGDCQWNQACTGQYCIGAATRSCGACGVQTRSCDGDTGTWGAWGECTDQKDCRDGDTRTCGDVPQTCGADCRWGEPCPGAPCRGPSAQRCGNCGIQTRMCLEKTGAWSAWSECTQQGVCSPAAARYCGENGSQICAPNCQWNVVCTDQRCDGPAARSCGNCGTQRRTCDPERGSWSEWSQCEGEGECSPNSMRECGFSGVQLCGEDCHYSVECLDQACPGNAAQACGKCGSRARVCDADYGLWSAWAGCVEEGDCDPGAERTCGRQGVQTCEDDCLWSAGCPGQTCIGESSEPCGLCGTRSRTCNSNTGDWSAWGACSGQGSCTPGATRNCGNGGTQTCGEDCQWGGACAGQRCIGASAEACGNCGTRTRSCDPSTGAWSAWSECVGQRQCAPGSTSDCGVGGRRTCQQDCTWGDECAGQMCPGAAAEACGSCGTRVRSCDMNTGTWSDWSGCSDEGVCMPGDTRACGRGGRQTCTDACAWSSACTGQTCEGPSTQMCGTCNTGTRTRVCNPGTGAWSDWSMCVGGACTPGSGGAGTGGAGSGGAGGGGSGGMGGAGTGGAGSGGGSGGAGSGGTGGAGAGGVGSGGSGGAGAGGVGSGGSGAAGSEGSGAGASGIEGRAGAGDAGDAADSGV